MTASILLATALAAVSGGSGTDNVKQLDRANWFGGLVWALPENEQHHPCFVVAPQTDVNWPAVRLVEGRFPEILPGPGRGGRLAIEIVERLAAELPVDHSRICTEPAVGEWLFAQHR